MSINQSWLKLHEAIGRLKSLVKIVEAEAESSSPLFQGILEVAIADLKELQSSPAPQVPAVITSCVFFAYSHGQIRESEAIAILGMQSKDFSDRWCNYLETNPEVAEASGWNPKILRGINQSLKRMESTEPAAGIPFFSQRG